jgi:hypothetical protein
MPDDPANDVYKITPLFPPTYFTLEHEARNLVEQLERHASTRNPSLTPAQCRSRVVDVLRAELDRLQATRIGCCARAASGHAAAPNSDMNSRRLISNTRPLRLKRAPVVPRGNGVLTGLLHAQSGAGRFAGPWAPPHVGSGHSRQTDPPTGLRGMSAMPPIATV